MQYEQIRYSTVQMLGGWEIFFALLEGGKMMTGNLQGGGEKEGGRWHIGRRGGQGKKVSI